MFRQSFLSNIVLSVAILSACARPKDTTTSTLGCEGCDKRPKPDGVQHIINSAKNATCTAAFINEYQAVTAAHCLFDKDGNFQSGHKLSVSFKEAPFSNGKAKEVNIQAACFHPEFPKFMAKIDRVGFEHITPLTLSPFDFAIINIGGHVCPPGSGEDDSCVPGPQESLANFADRIKTKKIPGMQPIGTSLRTLYLETGKADFETTIADSKVNGYTRILQEYLNLENIKVTPGPFTTIGDEASLFFGKEDINKAWITGLGPSASGEADPEESDLGMYNIGTLGKEHFEINRDLGVILSKRKIGAQEAPHIGKGDSGSPLYWRMEQTKEHEIFQRYSQANLLNQTADDQAPIRLNGIASFVQEAFGNLAKVKMAGGINSSFSRQFGIYASPISRYNRIITQALTWPNRIHRIKVGEESRTISMINEFGIIDLRSKRYSAGEGAGDIYTCNLNAAAMQVQNLHQKPEEVKKAACGGLTEAQTSCPENSNCNAQQGIFCPGNSHDALKNHFSKNSGEISAQKIADLTYMAEYFAMLKESISDKPKNILNIGEMQSVFAKQDAAGFQSLVLHDLAVRPRPYARVGRSGAMRAELNLTVPDPAAGEIGLEAYEVDDMHSLNQEISDRLSEVEYFDWSTNNAELPILTMGPETSADFNSLFVFKSAKTGECRGTILDLSGTNLLNAAQKSISDKHWAAVPAHCLESPRNTGDWSVTDAVQNLSAICSNTTTRMRGTATLPFECLNLSQMARFPQTYSDITPANGPLQQMAQYDIVLFPVRAKAGHSLQGMEPLLEIPSGAHGNAGDLFGLAFTDGVNVFGNVTIGYYSGSGASNNLIINPKPYGNASNASAIQIHNVQTEPEYSGAILFEILGGDPSDQVMKASCMHIGPLTGSDLQFSTIGNRCIHFSILKSVFAEGQGFVSAAAPAAQGSSAPIDSGGPGELDDPEETSPDPASPAEPPVVAAPAAAPIAPEPVVQNTVPNQSIPAPPIATLPTSCDICNKLGSSCFCCDNEAGLRCNIRATAPSSSPPVALADIPVVGQLPNASTVYRVLNHKDSGTQHRYWFEVETEAGLRGFVWEPNP